MLAVSALALYSRSGAIEWFVFAIASALFLGVWVVPYAAAGRITVEQFIEEGEGSLFVRRGYEYSINDPAKSADAVNVDER